MKMNRRFKKIESGFHESAKNILASWVGGITEQEFRIDGQIVFVPDVVVYENGIIQCIYEIVYKNQFTGHKLGRIQYYCYRNITELTVHEVSYDFILRQTEKPERIEDINCFIIGPFEYEEVEECLIKSIS